MAEPEQITSHGVTLQDAPGYMSKIRKPAYWAASVMIWQQLPRWRWPVVTWPGLSLV